MDWQLLMCYTYVCFRVFLLEIKLLLLAYKDIKYILKDNIKKKNPYAKNWKFPWTKHLLWQNMKVLILVGDSLPLLFFHKVPVIKWEFRFID